MPCETRLGNEDVVRQALLASNRGDVDAFLECLHADVEWESAGLFLHPAKVWRGHEDLRRGMEARVERHRGDPQVTLTELASSGPYVLVVGTLSIPLARPPVNLPESWIFELRDGRVARVQIFLNERGARAEWARRAEGMGG